LRDELPQEAFVAQTERLAVQAAEGEAPGSPWDEVARYLRALVALVKGEELPAVPTTYATEFAAVLAEKEKGAG
jgi:hypothetical protein